MLRGGHLDGNPYSTNGLAPISNCLDLTRGDRVDDLSSMRGAAGTFGTGGNCDPLRRRRTPKPPPRTLQVSTTSRAMPRGLRHAICPSRRGGPAVGRLRPARPRGGRAASCGPRAPADVSRRGGAPARRRGRAALCRGRVPGVPRVRMARWRVRTISVHWMPCRALGGVLVQGPGICGVLEYAEQGFLQRRGRIGLQGLPAARLRNISAYSLAPERCDQPVGWPERARSQLGWRHRLQHPDPLRHIHA